MKNKTLLTEIIQALGFKDLEDFKTYMIYKARYNEFGGFGYNEVREGLELSYSEGSNSKFYIMGVFNGRNLVEYFNII